METVYEIRKGIPAPSLSKGKTGMTRTLRAMEHMDSIVIPNGKRNGVFACANHAGIKIQTQGNPDGSVTVWRIDPGSPRPTATDPSPTVPQAHDGGANESIFSGSTPVAANPAPATSSSAPVNSAPSPAPRRSPWPKITRTIGDLDLGLPEGYYIQQDPYSPEIWHEGPPPEEYRSPRKEAAPNKTKPDQGIFS